MGFTSEEIREATLQVQDREQQLRELQKAAPRSSSTVCESPVDCTAQFPALSLSKNKGKKLCISLVDAGVAAQKTFITGDDKDKSKAKALKGFKVKLPFFKFGSKQHTSSSVKSAVAEPKDAHGHRSTADESKATGADTSKIEENTAARKTGDSVQPSKETDVIDVDALKSPAKPNEQSGISPKVRKKRGRKPKSLLTETAGSSEAMAGSEERLNDDAAADSSPHKTKQVRTYHYRQFILPTVSSRSSRKIIPSKRFLEGEGSGGFGALSYGAPAEQYQPVTEKKRQSLPLRKPRKVVDLASDSRRSSLPVSKDAASAAIVIGDDDTPTKESDEPRAETVHAKDSQSQEVESQAAADITSTPADDVIDVSDASSDTSTKRDRVVSKKSQLKGVPGAPKGRKKRDGCHTRQRKIGSLDMPILVEGKRERKPNIRLKDLFASKEKPSAEAAQAAARQSGKNILHKAKLRLNQTALNKSKTDLAKKLQREMKTAETAATQQESAAALKTKRPQFAPLGALAGQISPLKLTGAESPSQARAGSSRKGTLFRASVLM